MASSNSGQRILPPDTNNMKTFENLCKIQCTQEEIAGVFEVSISTLKRFCKEAYNMSFERVYKIYASSGKASLRRHQFKQAEKNAIMGIWLGKQYLGQKEVIETHSILEQTEDDALTKAIRTSVTSRKKQKRIDVEEEDEDLEDFEL